MLWLLPVYQCSRLRQLLVVLMVAVQISAQVVQALVLVHVLVHAQEVALAVVQADAVDFINVMKVGRSNRFPYLINFSD